MRHIFPVRNATTKVYLGAIEVDDIYERYTIAILGDVSFERNFEEGMLIKTLTLHRKTMCETTRFGKNSILVYEEECFMVADADERFLLKEPNALLHGYPDPADGARRNFARDITRREHA